MRAKKSLGQNFLKSKGAVSAMRDALDPLPDDIVVEIGPGKGALTESLLPFAGRVVAVEKDTELVEYMKQRFDGAENLDIVEGDILDFDIKVLDFYEEEYKVIGNIPYYITGAIIKKFLTSENQPTTIVLLIQKEVAERIVSRDGKESVLSLSVKAFGEPRYVKKVPARSFSPAPKVDSAIIEIDEINRDNFETISDERKFFKVVKTGFAHKRKKLVNNLEQISDKETVLRVFERLALDENTRAENIPLEKWLELSKSIDV